MATSAKAATPILEIINSGRGVAAGISETTDAVALAVVTGLSKIDLIEVSLNTPDGGGTPPTAIAAAMDGTANGTLNITSFGGLGATLVNWSVEGQL